MRGPADRADDRRLAERLEELAEDEKDRFDRILSQPVTWLRWPAIAVICGAVAREAT